MLGEFWRWAHEDAGDGSGEVFQYVHVIGSSEPRSRRNHGSLWCSDGETSGRLV